MLTPVDLTCPYCGEGFQTLVDGSAGSHHTIEDCPVCCHPIELRVRVDRDGAPAEVQALRDDE